MRCIEPSPILRKPNAIPGYVEFIEALELLNRQLNKPLDIGSNNDALSESPYAS